MNNILSAKNKIRVVTALTVLICMPAHAINTAAYQITTFKNFQRLYEFPTDKEVAFDAQLPAIEVVLRYEGKQQPLSAAHVQFLQNFSKVLPGAIDSSLYKEEISVSEQGHTYWLPIQSKVLTDFLSQIKPSQEFTSYVRSLGATKTQCAYVLIDYDEKIDNTLQPSSSPIDGLAGVRCGQSWNETAQALEKRLGPSFASGRRETGK